MAGNSAHELARLLIELGPVLGRMLALRLRRPPGAEAMLPPHMMLLRRLQLGPASQGALAQQMRVSPSTMSATIDALERRGWVARERDETDRRVTRVVLTEAGQAVLTTMDVVAASALDDLISTLSEAEIQQAVAGLRVLRNLFIRTAQAEEAADPPAWTNGPMPFPPPFPPPMPPPGFGGPPGDMLFFTGEPFPPPEADEPPATF